MAQDGPSLVPTSTSSPRTEPQIHVDASNEQLRSRLNKLSYELDSLRRDRDLTALRHEDEVRRLEQRAEADFKRAQTAERDAVSAQARHEELLKRSGTESARLETLTRELEKKIRDLESRNSQLAEQVLEVRDEAAGAARRGDQRYRELDGRFAALREGARELEDALTAARTTTGTVQVKLAERERRVGELEAAVLRLEKESRDADGVEVVKKQLSEQVAYVRKLETTGRQREAELKLLRASARAVQVVEEEKKQLAVKVRLLDDVRRELAEAQLQRTILEDERTRWTSYLGRQSGKDGHGLAFESPEELARAFVAERIDRLALLDRLGTIKPELAVKQDTIENLEAERTRLTVELRRARTLGGNADGTDENKIRARLERQRNLAVKEVDYLRAQIKAYEAEEGEFGHAAGHSDDATDTAGGRRVAELEGLVDEYRTEIKRLHESLAEFEGAATAGGGKKRAHDDGDGGADERVGELQRRSRAMQDELDRMGTANTRLSNELAATAAQLDAVRESSRTRVLQVRDNPTARAEAVKLETLRNLREENTALRSQVEGRQPATKVVPQSSLTAARLEMAELQATLDRQIKKEKRLKSIWSQKFGEFTDAVESTLGWQVAFQSNGRFKVIPSVCKSHVNDRGEEEENSILFDGEQGTMKVSGGKHSKWEEEIRNLIEYWVDGRKQVPCFLAAVILDSHEKKTS